MLGFVLAQSASVIYCSFIVILNFVLALLENIVNAAIFSSTVFPKVLVRRLENEYIFKKKDWCMTAATCRKVPDAGIRPLAIGAWYFVLGTCLSVARRSLMPAHSLWYFVLVTLCTWYLVFGT